MSKIWYVIAGALIGLVAMVSGSFAFAALIGVAVAFTLVEIRALSRRVAVLEDNRIPDLPAAETAGEAPQPPDEREIAADIDVSATPSATAVAADAVAPLVSATAASAAGQSPPSSAAVGRKADPFVETVKDWFASGNVPVKVGVIVSFFGVAFLLKYAVERNLLIVPMWLRLVFAGLFGLALLAVGWRLRQRMRVYALSLQGGGVGIIYLTVFAAFRLYGLLPPVPAFVLLALITIPAAMLAVVQDARAMAVLAVTGGFLAPILTSTGQGSHVALFSYYLLLNLSIVGIAWFKSWRELNLIGFLFTFVIGTSWGYRYYRPEYFSSTEPFLIAHFFLYQAAAILFAFRQPPKLRGVVDGTLIFGTPIVAFALQAALLKHTEYGLAYSAVALAVVYAALGFWLHGRGAAMRLLRDSYAALGVAFATVAVPLAFDARWTASTWAMEGAALVWLGVRQSALLSRFAGVALIALAGAAFIVGGWDNDAGMPVLNGNVLGGGLISLAGFFSARQLGGNGHRFAGFLSIALFVWGMGWWLTTGLAEINDRVRHAIEYPAMVAFFALSGAALSLVGRRLDWAHARYGSLALLPLLATTLVGRGFAGGHPLESSATAPWLIAAGSHFYVLKPFKPGSLPGSGWHVAGVLLAAWLVAWEIDWWIVVDTWSNATISLMLTLLAVSCWLLRPVLSWPLQAERLAYLLAAGLLLALNLLFAFGFSIDGPGDPLPFPYLPLLNPYDATIAVALAGSCFWIREAGALYELAVKQRRALLWILGAAVLVLSTIAIVRSVHHFADVPWRQYSLTHSVEVQAALSIYWGFLGFGAMILGARRRARFMWMLGSSLMALVVVKLFLVDLGNSGTVARIVSFIGVGALLLVVGYFAPAPPRKSVNK